MVYLHGVLHVYLMAKQFLRWPIRFTFNWSLCPNNILLLYCTLVLVYVYVACSYSSTALVEYCTGSDSHHDVHHTQSELQAYGSPFCF